MRKLVLALAAVLPLVFTSGMASAQKLETGKWTGNVVDPNGNQIEVTYDVTMKSDTIGITVTAAEHGSFTFSDVKLSDKTLTFWFSPGTRVECSLARRDDAAFEGSCKDTDGGTARMLMVPPKKG